MHSSARERFAIRPHDAQGVWESNDGRYRAYAHELLAQLEVLCTEILAAWPSEAGASITDDSRYPELWKLARLRDRTSDTVRIYAAMAAEGFLNFYGVLRLGQRVYDEHFERLGAVPKLRSLLLICDQLEVPRNDPLVLCLDRLAQSRNALVHPKTREVLGNPATQKRSSTKLPEVAQESVANMEAFFEQFVQAVPDARPQIARKTAA